MTSLGLRDGTAVLCEGTPRVVLCTPIGNLGMGRTVGTELPRGLRDGKNTTARFLPLGRTVRHPMDTRDS